MENLYKKLKKIISLWRRFPRLQGRKSRLLRISPSEKEVMPFLGETKPTMGEDNVSLVPESQSLLLYVMLILSLFFLFEGVVFLTKP